MIYRINPIKILSRHKGLVYVSVPPCWVTKDFMFLIIGQ